MAQTSGGIYKMKTEEEVRELIKKTEEAYAHVLELKGANIMTNSPRALMQLEATTTINAYYKILNEKRPSYLCDEFEV